MSAESADQRTDTQRARVAALARAAVLVELSRRLKAAEGDKDADGAASQPD